MKKIKKLLGSMYVKFIIIFVLIILFANLISFRIISSDNLQIMQEYREVIENLPNASELVGHFVNAMKGYLIISCILSSVFIVIGIYIILKPIKKISSATKIISQGNFEVEIVDKKKQRKDEIGELISNFNKMAKSLEKNEYVHKDFVSSVSHEIKTPITAIAGFAELLKDDNLPYEKKEEYLGVIISESSRLSNLSRNLLKLSELDNKVIYEKKEFSLDEQIRRVILLLQNKWEEKHIELDIDIDKVIFIGDEELFEIIWINLIGNAIKFSKENGKISIKLKEENNQILASIQDCGIGILESDKEYIFERFYIADKSRNKEGTGLGLSIVKKIISIYDGKIYFESQREVGTTFYIKLDKSK